jgi:NADPH:quinone reductase-like Zn-dependent oxidoreductase
MKAFAISTYKDDLSLQEFPDPRPGPGEVVVDIKAASVNPLDEKIRNGEFKTFLKYDMPLILGNDVAGVVSQVGPGVSRFKVGDEVFGKVDVARIGTFAEQIAVAENDLARKPANISMSEAASLPLVLLTAWQVLVERANVQPGQKVLIHAGSGGVGTIAIQLAKHLGATVATTASAANAATMHSLGADIVIDYRNDDFTQRLEGYDVVLTSLGPDILERSLTILRRGGKLISLSGPPDPAFGRAIGAKWIVRQILRLMSARIRRLARKSGADYSFLFMRADGAQLAKAAALVEAGTIKPVVAATLPFEKTAEALGLIEKSRGPGKIVVVHGAG